MKEERKREKDLNTSYISSALLYTGLASSYLD